MIISQFRLNYRLQVGRADRKPNRRQSHLEASGIGTTIKEALFVECTSINLTGIGDDLDTISILNEVQEAVLT